MSATYTHRFRQGDALICPEGTNFIPAGSIVVFDRNTFAPFVQVLVPGYTRRDLGHFHQEDFRLATADELHTALPSRRP